MARFRRSFQIVTGIVVAAIGFALAVWYSMPRQAHGIVIYGVSASIAEGDVLSKHILDGTIVDADINAKADIAVSKIYAGGPQGAVFFSNGSYFATSTALSFATSTNTMTINGNLDVSGQTTLNGVTYTWPNTAGNAGDALVLANDGTLAWESAGASVGQLKLVALDSATMFFTDSFDRPNGTSVGNGWSETSSTYDRWGIDNNTLISFYLYFPESAARVHRYFPYTQNAKMDATFNDSFNTNPTTLYLRFDSDGSCTKGFGAKFYRDSNTAVKVSIVHDNTELTTPSSQPYAEFTNYHVRLTWESDNTVRLHLGPDANNLTEVATATPAASPAGYGKFEICANSQDSGGVRIDNLSLKVLTVPGTEGYLEANGQAVSRTTYADLFRQIGTAFGAGDGSTTFNIPNPSVPDANSNLKYYIKY